VISLIIPMYNPGLAAEQCFHRVRDFLRFRRETWEVVFVSDGSTDSSVATLRRLCQVHDEKRFQVIEYTPNRGKGFAVKTGMLAARGKYRLFTDIDLFFLHTLGKAADALKDGAAMVIASRTHTHSEFAAPFTLIHYLYRRKLQSMIFSRVVRTLLPIPQRDTQAGLKGMSAEVAERLLPHTQIQGFSFDCEWLMAATKMHIPVVEIPVCVRYGNTASTIRMTTGLRMLRELWQIRQAWSRSIPEPQGLHSPPAMPTRWSRAA